MPCSFIWAAPLCSGTCALLCILLQAHACLQAFELALEMAGNAQPETTLFMDDSTRNINGAHKAGLKTVLVGRTAMPDVDADLQVGCTSTVLWLCVHTQPCPILMPLGAVLLQRCSLELSCIPSGAEPS